MYKIIKKEVLAPSVCMMEIEDSRLAAAAQPGQFLIVRNDEKGERIPLTICDFDRERGTVSIVIQAIGASTKQMCEKEEGDFFADVVGPLGKASDFINEADDEVAGKRYLFIAGGIGAAPVYPQAKYLHSKGAKVDVIIGAKTSGLLIFEDMMAKVCDNLHICTDDGTEGFKGLVTEKIKQLVADGNKYDQAVSIGPMIMMKFCTLTMKSMNIPLVVSLNTLMVDGTGMCGACRVSVGGKTRFACVDGPEFDAYQVDFDEAMRRQGQYKNFEKAANERYDEQHKCHCHGND